MLRKVLAFIITSFIAPVCFANWGFVIESGAVWQHQNDVRIPNDTGDRLDFDAFDQGPFLHYRAEILWRPNEKHNFRAVYAPFNVVVNGSIPSNLNFDGVTFTASEELEVDYSFNSYRLTYFYSFWGTKDEQFNLGFTGKIRDAEIIFSQPSQRASYDNTGFVPLLYIEFQTPINSDWRFNMNADAAAASQGRAIDLAVKLRRSLFKDFELGLGLRSLEGGADNDKVYTFSWFNYAVLDIKGHF